jgi:hypothetical protein
MSNYRDRVPFAGLPGGGRVYHAQILWRSRLPRSILPRKLIILVFRFINSCAGSVGNFSMHAERHFLGSRAPACQESAGIWSRGIPSDTFWSDILWLSGRISSKAGRRHFRAQLERTQAFRAGLVCRHFETAGRQFKSAGISRTQAS